MISKVKAWTRQKHLQKMYSSDMPEIPELSRIIDNPKTGWAKANPTLQIAQAKALFALYYLTACRLSEMIRLGARTTKENTHSGYLRKRELMKRKVLDNKGAMVTKYYTPNSQQAMQWIEKHNKDWALDKLGRIIIREKLPHDYIGIKRQDIEFGIINGKKVMYIRTENRKHKDKKTKRQPIPIEFEKPIVDFIAAYARNIPKEQVLFDFGVKRATQIINKAYGFNIHFIRHIRLTHLVTKYDFNEQMLIKFAGWTDGRPAKHYMELGNKDLFNAFYKNK